MFQNDDCALCNKSKVRQYRKQANASIMICATVFCSLFFLLCVLVSSFLAISYFCVKARFRLQNSSFRPSLHHSCTISLCLENIPCDRLIAVLLSLIIAWPSFSSLLPQKSLENYTMNFFSNPQNLTTHMSFCYDQSN